MQDRLKYTRSEQAHRIWMQGDKDKQIEPPEVYLHFPGGFIGITRVDDDTYWIHASLVDCKDEDSGNREFVGKVIDSRIDLSNKAPSEADTGDLNNEHLEHFAVKVKVNR